MNIFYVDLPTFTMSYIQWIFSIWKWSEILSSAFIMVLRLFNGPSMAVTLSILFQVSFWEKQISVSTSKPITLSLIHLTDRWVAGEWKVPNVCRRSLCTRVNPHAALLTNLTNIKWCKNLKNDWNPGKWVLIWEYSVRAIKWVPWHGLDISQISLLLCALDESSLSIWRVKFLCFSNG